MKKRAIGADIRRLVLSALCGILVLAAILAVNLYHDRVAAQARDDRRVFQDAATHAQLALARALDTQRRFLDLRDEAVVAEHQAAIAELTAYLDQMRDTLPPGLSNSFANIFDRVSADVDDYASATAELFQLRRDLGLTEDQGLEGALRAAVHGVETALNAFEAPRLRVKMLMMRRHEKDFILRGHQKYVDRLDQRVEEFLASPASMFPDRGTQVSIFEGISSYQEAFRRYAASALLRDGAAARAIELYGGISPALTALAEASQEDILVAEEAALQSERIWISVTIGLVLAIAIGVAVLSVRISRRLRTPWRQAADVIDALSRGEQRAGSIDATYLEVDQVAEAILNFRDCVVAQEAEAAARRDLEKAEADRIVSAAKQKAKQEEEAAEAKRARARKARLEREQEIVKEISEVVQACGRGDFSRKLDTDNSVSSLADICHGVNRIGDVTNQGLTDIRECLSALAEGNLTHRMADNHEGIFGEIRETMNSTAGVLGTMIGQIDRNSQAMEVSTSEVVESSLQMSRRAERSAVSLEEMAAATSALSAAVRSTADNAKDADDRITEVRDQVTASLAVVGRTVAAMAGVRDASAEISKITGLINDIAFQTNLLALNAGVEAARAGAAGQGFAVVAAEVRNLATRSAEAAQTISDLIADSVDQVERGSTLVDETGAALQTIASRVEAAADKMAEIAGSADQQAARLTEVDSSTKALDAETRESVTVVARTATASKQLEQVVKELSMLVSNFSDRERDLGGRNNAGGQAA